MITVFSAHLFNDLCPPVLGGEAGLPQGGGGSAAGQGGSECARPGQGANSGARRGARGPRGHAGGSREVRRRLRLAGQRREPAPAPSLARRTPGRRAVPRAADLAALRAQPRALNAARAGGDTPQTGHRKVATDARAPARLRLVICVCDQR